VLILGLFGGVIADALPKRPTIIVTQASSMILAFVLGALVYTNTVQVWHVLVLAFLLGSVNAIDMPTRQAFVIEMVGREDVVNAVVLNSAAFNAARIVGPAIAGITIGVVGIALCFVLNGLSFVAVIVGLLIMRDGELRPARVSAVGHSAGAVFANLGEGLAYVRRTPEILLAVTVVGAVSTFGMNFNVLVPVYAQTTLGTGAEGYGFLMTASGLGSLVAALSLAYVGRASPRVLVAGGSLLGLLEVLLAFARVYPLAVVGLFGVGFGAIAMTASANTCIQLAVPDHLRGRVVSVYTTVFAGTTPFGSLFAGSIAAAAGAPASLLAGGALSLASAVAAFLIWRDTLGPVRVPRRHGDLRAVPETAEVAEEASRR